MRLFPRTSIFVFLAVFALTMARAGEPAIVAKARAFVGPEATLASLKSVHYVGTVLTTDANDPTKQTKAKIDIITQKPNQQRVVASTDKAVETTSLDGYEGWQRIEDATDPKKYRQVVFKPDAVKRLRAQAAENLFFFRGVEQQGGRCEVQGKETVEGVACEKVAFIYAPNIIFYRYFDPQTGRLVQTQTEDGGLSYEVGEKMINGLRFPAAMKMIMKGPTGQQTVIITFDSITLNETFPASIFRVPSPGSEQKK